VHRQARVDDGVDEQDVAIGELRVEILQEPDPFVALAVAGDLDEIECVQRFRGAREIGYEGNARLERADQQGLPSGVVLGDRGADLPDAALNLVLFEEDLADSAVGIAPRSRGQGAQDAFCSPNRAARRWKSRS
jgi:hypothetical protein